MLLIFMLYVVNTELCMLHAYLFQRASLYNLLTMHHLEDYTASNEIKGW
jgi:hypothetical protein